MDAAELRDVYGRPVLIASEGGITFWTGNHPLSPGDGDMAANPAIKLREPAPPRRASRPHRGAARADLLPRGVPHDRDASGVVARPARSGSSSTSGSQSARRTCSTRACSCRDVVSYGLLLPFGLPACGGWPGRHRRLAGCCCCWHLRSSLPRVLAAGAVPDSGDRSRPHRRGGGWSLLRAARNSVS